MPFLDSTEGVSHLSVCCEFKFCELFTDEEKRLFISSVSTKTGDSTWSVAGGSSRKKAKDSRAILLRDFWNSSTRPLELGTLCNVSQNEINQICVNERSQTSGFIKRACRTPYVCLIQPFPFKIQNR